MLAFIDYSIALQRMGIAAEETPDFLSSAPPVANQECWALIMPVLASDMMRLIERVFPSIKAKNLAFRMIRHEGALYKMNGGGMPHNMIGRSLTIFAKDLEQANELIPLLSKCTEDLQSIDIPVAARLSETVFVNQCRWTENEGWVQSLPPTIPFKVPKKYRRNSSKTIAHRYRVQEVLNHSWKGSVFFAKYFHWWKRLPCVIKMGRHNAAADPYGRTIADRHKSEQQILRFLAGKVRVPKVIDAFQYRQDHYLVLEHIPGNNALRILNDMLAGEPWHSLSIATKRQILALFLQMAELVQQVHAHGVIHRDITPANFIWTNANLYLIDFELAFQMETASPSPPFIMGTVGFVAPEQMMLHSPTPAEDVYSLTAILYYLVAGQPIMQTDPAFQDLHMLSSDVLDHDTIELIKKGLEARPEDRISLTDMIVRVRQALTITSDIILT